MIRRILDALHRELADQVPQRQFRPNELSREVVAADRRRRVAPSPQPARAPVAPAPDEQPRPKPQAVYSAPQARAGLLASSLRSRSELRRALLLKEILGPPAALRWPRDGDPEAL